MEDEKRALKDKSDVSYLTQEVFELKSFRSCLKWVCLDQSNLWKACLSWFMFLLLAIGWPIVSHFVLSCPNCDDKHRMPYDAVIQLSLSVFAIISFFSLSSWSRKYGLKRFLFLNKLCNVSEKVRHGYAKELQKSMKLLTIFVFPSFALEGVYKIWWYATGSHELPYFGNIFGSDIIACTLQLSSWLYRTSIFVLACIIYRLTCYLQVLRLDDFAQFFQQESDVGSILKEHLDIRRSLQIISHRFRAFVLLSLFSVTVSQFMSLLMTTRSKANGNIYEAGELSLCSISLLTGVFICLRSATKITHKAQAVTSLAAKWYVCATVNLFDDDVDGELPRSEVPPTEAFPVSPTGCGSDDDEGEGDDDALDNTTLEPIYTNTVSFQKKQALVSYLKNNKAGITVFGFIMDRTWLQMIFGIEFGLMLWLLNKTLVNFT